MTALIPRLMAAVVLAVWGGVLCYFYFSGRILSYLHPNFFIPTLLCGFAFLVMAVGLLFASRPVQCEDPECCNDIEDKVRPFTVVVWAVLIVPIVVAAVVSPWQFGPTAILNRGFVVSIEQLPGAGSFKPFVEPPLPGEDDSGEAWRNDPSMDAASYLARNEDGRILTETIDLLFAAQEDAIRADFDNQEIEVIGQIMPARTNNPMGDRFNLVRLFIMCCAADGRPIAVPVRGPPEAAGLPEMSWVKVTGRATFPLESGRRVPLILADSVEETDPPAETFLY